MKQKYNLESFGTIKRRTFHKTQNSSMKLLTLQKEETTTPHQKIERNLFGPKQNSQSQRKIRTKSNSSHKNLFKEAKSIKNDCTYLKKKHEDRFQFPSQKSRALTISDQNMSLLSKQNSLQSPKMQQFASATIQQKKKHLQFLLTKKMNPGNSGFNTAMNTIDSETQQTIKQELSFLNSKRFDNNHKKIEQAFSLKFQTEQKKDNLEKSMRKVIETIEEAIQTEPEIPQHENNFREQKSFYKRFYTESEQVQGGGSSKEQPILQSQNFQIKNQNKKPNIPLNKHRKQSSCIQKSKELQLLKPKQVKTQMDQPLPSKKIQHHIRIEQPTHQNLQDKAQDINSQSKQKIKKEEIQKKQPLKKKSKPQKKEEETLKEISDQKNQKQIQREQKEQPLPITPLKTVTKKQIKKQSSQQKNSYFQAATVDLDQLEDITLSPQSKLTSKKPQLHEQKAVKQKQKQKQKQDQQKREQEAEKQKQRKIKQEQKKKVAQEEKKKEKEKKQQEKRKQAKREQEQKNRIKKENESKKMKQKQKQLEKDKEKQQAEKKRKKKIQEELSQANLIIDSITPMGEVAGFCSQSLKKIKVNWHLPAILQYKRCYQIFTQYEDIYERSAAEGIISQQQKQKYFSDNETIKNNLQKIVAMGKKKGKIDAKYDEIIGSNTEKIDEIIQQTVINFHEEVEKCGERDNPNVLQCLLRMINSVMILGNLQGHKYQLLDIDSIQQANLKPTIAQTIPKISKKKLKL